MKRRDRKKQQQEPEVPEVEVPAGPRAAGPWDATEKRVGDDPAYIDLGALLVRVRVGLNLQTPTDDDGNVGSVVLVTDDAGLELRAFAASRSGGLWDEVRADLLAEVGRLEGEVDRVDGPFGPELRVRVPVKLPEGESGFQPTRILGVEGPRWLLRATFLGRAALEPSDEGILMDALKDVVVVRGEDPRIPREALHLTVGTKA